MMDASSFLAESGTAAGDLLRLEVEEMPEPLPVSLEAEVKKLRAYEGWQDRVRTVLHTYSKIVGAPNPAGWEVSTACHNVRVVRTVLETTNAVGIPVTEFSDLQTTAVLDALEARLVRKSHPQSKRSAETAKGNASPLPATWGGVYLYGILRALRTVLHASGLDASADLNSRIKYHATAKPRSIDHRLFKKETYLAGAMALDAFGRIALASGRSSGYSIRTGARLLGVVADGSPRRSEMGLADRRLVHDNLLTTKPEVKVFVRRRSSKARRPRVLCITDPRAIRLLAELRRSPGGDDLFTTNDGNSIGLPTLDAILRRVTTLAVGQPANYNILRRANAEAQPTTASRAAKLAHAPESRETNGTYHRTLVQRGVAALANSRAALRIAAENWVSATSSAEEDAGRIF